MNIKIDSSHNIVNKVSLDLNPTEFMLVRHILNLTCVHTELHEVDSRLASKMYREIEEYIKEKQK